MEEYGDARLSKVSAKLAERQGFRGAQLLDIGGSVQQLNSSHLRERDKTLFCVVGFGTVFCWRKPGRRRYCAVSVGKKDGDGHLFLGVYLSPCCARQGTP